jgi:uracil-DNA glycosylase
VTAAPPDLRRFFRLLDELRGSTPDDAEFLYESGTPHGDLRRRNLERYLDLLGRQGARMLLVGEAPGHRGTTVTGVPFMSLRQLDARPGLITGAEEGDGFLAPQDPAALWEASSRDVWAALAGWNGPLPVSWPIYPNHPFEPGRPASNRTPRPAEVRAGTPIALELAHALDIDRIVAVGRKAQGALAANGIVAEAVRHPAQGGARLFATQLTALAR